ncbi:MAG: hypothetical protein P4L99_16305 [Chthoniobacter sp.]|nr:hypothetical protein [Chthoniobacter sp.]
MIARTSIRRLTICGVCALWLGFGAVQALDLTPHRGWREGNEGPATVVIRFSDGKCRIDYQPPPGWQPSGGGRAVTFFTADSTSWMKLMVVDKSNAGPQGSTAVAKEDLRAWAAKLVPPGAEKLQFVRMVDSPFTLGTHASTEFIFNCALRGFRQTLSISVVDFSNQERLVVLISAEPGNFEQIRRQAIASMFSWSLEG